MHNSCSPSHHCAHLASTRAAFMATAVELLVTHYCMFAARAANAILPNRVDIGSARFGLTAAPQANCECFRLHDCIVGRSLHARLQRLCSTAGRQVPGTRCHVAGLLCRTCSQAMARISSSNSPTHARAAVKFPCVVTAFPISKSHTLHCIVSICVSGLLF